MWGNRKISCHPFGEIGHSSLCEVEVFEGTVLHHVEAIYMEYKICNDITAK